MNKSVTAMQRYNIYIMKHVASATAIITVSLTSIVWLTQALRFIDFIVSKGISFGSFLEMTLLLLPSLLLFVLPFALLCAVLYVYYRLMMDSELLVLSGAGLSRLQIAKPALNIALAVTGLAYAISLYILPLSYGQFKDMQAFLRDNFASLLLQEEVFNTPVDGLTVFIRERSGDGTLRGILVHDSRDSTKAPITMMAEEGRLMQTPKGPRFILHHGSRQQMDKGKISFLDFDEYTLDISFYTSAASKRARQPEEMYLNELLFPDADATDSWRLIAEGHNRLAWPLYSFALALLAVAVLLSGEFNRRGKWQRVTAVIMVAAMALASSVGLLNLAARQPWMVILLYANVLGIALAGMFLLVNEKGKAPRARMEAIV